MRRYLAVLGRQPLISVAELESLFTEVKLVGRELAEFEAEQKPQIARLGGTLKLAEKIEGTVVDFLKTLPAEGKITLGVSDYTRGASAFKAQGEALKLKRILVKMGRSVRVVPNKTAVLSTATTLHNHLFTETKVELIKNGKTFYRVVGVQDIDAYAERDQARPARDAKIGMLPPKLAQILINLTGKLPEGARLLDPFCGTGVVLQEAALMGYVPYGTDVNPRMVEYSQKNLEWLSEKLTKSRTPNEDSASNTSIVAQISKNVKHELVAEGDATNYTWEQPVDAVAGETYLGPPMSMTPTGMKLRQAKEDCKSIIIGFLKNLAGQIEPGTPVAIAVPAWRRENGNYERLNILDEIQNLGYNVRSFKNLEQKDLLYHREGQVVAREIIVLRKK